MNHLSLFSGIGGIDLAAEWAGFKTVAFCEKADYPARVFEKRFPGVKRFKDVRDVSRETVREPIKLVSGGFPCQPFSTAGKRRGQEDDRYLWPEMLRVIQEIRPTWVVGENVAGFANLGLRQTISDLEERGYGVEPYEIPACAVGAPFQRYRIFIVAHDDNRPELATQEVFTGWNTAEHGCSDVTDPLCQGPQIGQEQEVGSGDLWRQWEAITPCTWWAVEPDLVRVVPGVPRRVDRIKGLGNAVVPHQIYPILKAIALIEGAA